MSLTKITLIIVMTCTYSLLFAQDADIFSNSPGLFSQTSKTQEMNISLFSQTSRDYRVISSNSTYIEVEYTLTEPRTDNIEFNGEKLSVFEFRSGIANDLKYSGSPDLRFRSFAVMLPSERNNSLQIIDFDVKEQQNVDIAPIPRLGSTNPNDRSFENIYYTYNKNSEYSQNKFLPEQFVSIINIGLFRDITTGNLIIYPYQYNPVTKILKVYSRVRIRINYGESPVLLNKPRSKEEVALLSNTAINSNTAMNWVNPKYRDIFRDHIVTNSVLATGDWYKIEIKDNGDGLSEGMYKITKSFLEGAGINLSNVDPRTIKMYGNGGELLPEMFIDPRPVDLQQNAVYIEGENDGHFDNSDYILFYARSVNPWVYDTVLHTYNHQINYYSRSNYYWICFNTPGNGLRMQLSPSQNTGGAINAGSFTEHIFFEPEQANLINEGNLWLSIRKNPGQSIEWTTTLTGLVNGSEILYRCKLASRCLPPNVNSFLIKDEYSNMSEYPLPLGNASTDFGNWIDTQIGIFTVSQSQKTNGEQVKLRSTYSASNGESEGYLDWYEILYKRRLNSASGDVLRFNSPDTSGIVEYNVSSFSSNNIKVFDVSLNSSVKIIQPLNATSSNVRFQRTENAGTISKYFVNGENGYKAPTGISSRISNQNLRGISTGASFIIITHKDFIQAADRLKNKRELGGPTNPDYLKTIIVTVDQIYNEFSGGLVDAVALRDF